MRAYEDCSSVRSCRGSFDTLFERGVPDGHYRPSQAHEGENTTVCGVVASERTATNSRGTPTFINLDSAYPKQVFTILVWGDDRNNVGEMPRNGSRICVTGLIADYHGVPEIVVKNKGQLSR
jgi:hypothetical protein